MPDCPNCGAPYEEEVIEQGEIITNEDGEFLDYEPGIAVLAPLCNCLRTETITVSY